jgi:flavin reductase (DIM6/NTAB) family NADH-FMN oxidoreductase RutF
VHLLGVDQLELAQRFADPDVDRFADTSSWERLATGEPAFLGSRVRLRGRVIDRHVYGVSTVLAVEVLDVTVADDAATRAPLAFHDRTWHQLGEASRLV